MARTQPRAPTVLVIEHEEGAGPVLLGEWLEAAGTSLSVCRPYAGEAVPERCAGDGLVVLGGGMGAADDEEATWLPATRSLIAREVGAGLPTLGVCLGAQLVALALGGRVERGGAGPEIGVSELELCEAASSDRLFGPMRPPVAAAQWHLDAITALPPGSVLLARGRPYEVQAFRVGESCWGVQFHPEVDEQVFKTWAATEHSPEVSAQAIETAVAEVARRQGELARTWQGLGARFAAVVTEHAARRAAGAGADA